MTGASRARIAALAALGWSGLAQAAYQMNLPTPRSPISAQILDLHNIIMVIIFGIAIVVFGAMFYSILKHRKSLGHQAAHFHENTTVEVVWTVIPFIILVGMAYPATKTMLAMRDTSSPDMSIKITGYQWKWGYEYPAEGIHFYSSLATPKDQIENRAAKSEHYLLEVDEPMVVPVGKKIRLLITAADVIHAWWVPALGVKQDAIPGYIKDSWFRAENPGTYRGQCAELCGKDHGFMPIVVEAKSEADYQKWVAEKKAKGKMAAVADEPNKVWSADELKDHGEKVYAANCASCHQANGQGIPGTFPAITGSKIATGPKAAHEAIVMNGKPGTAMSAWAKQLSDTDLAAVITFQRNGLGNSVGDVVQPSEIKGLRK